MSDNPNLNPAGPQGDPAPKDPQNPEGDLGDAGRKALNAERDARKAAEQRASDLQKQLDAAKADLTSVKNAGLPEWQKQIEDLQGRLDAEIAARMKAEQDAEQAAVDKRRIDRAATKGLPAALAKKLTGTTDEELDAEIDELLPFIGTQGPLPNPQQGIPSQSRGGTLSAGRERYKATNPQ